MPCLAALCLAAGTFTITDGDTFRTEAQAYRIWGIDAPEPAEDGGFAAEAALVALIGGQDLACEIMDRDRYGRDVVRCETPDGSDIACALVAGGHARDWPRYSGGYYGECDD
ncbi:thermonuclease family protein [Roseibacterium beibuensis]|uniref:TNase-like domain-containing protein n=1 Tax=[Roseibacterium] beibuensis TaxID=1193142 RepID=A0ABP9LAX2_9RHOB|nr:thermonuclease family protein [Roseibacterium beibuensis]MCS6624327.1 thermonuclease family protein [Roseibacterium beibuensis]